ncbi:MAG: hypothetical protein IJB90_02475 [Clostridia bacterium]|nr:hypothetical protein [Clostridia bacterium]
MKIIYVTETEDTCDIIKRIVLKIKCFFNIIYKENVEEKIIYKLPIFSSEKISNNKVNKLSKRIIKKLENDGIYSVALSKYLSTLQNLKNNFYSENINILDGRFLFKCLTFEVIEYILKRKNKKIQESEIYLLVNDFNNINKELIIYIAKSVKKLNIVTNHINKCKDIENYLYNEFGILLNIINNKKTSISNSEIILNFDFPEEVLNKYKIYRKAIIVNFQEKVSIQCKKFNGININYFKTNIPKKYKLQGFKDEEIYESIIYKKDLYSIKKMITEDKIRIRRLIGNNGCIMDREYIDKL